MARTTLTILILFIFSIAQGKSKLDIALITLDSLLADRETYQETVEKHIHGIYSLYEMAPNNESKYELALQLCNTYSSYNIDSAMVYANTVFKLAQENSNDQVHLEANLILAKTYLLGGMFSEAGDILDAINTKQINADLLLEYYTIRTTQYRYLIAYVSGSKLLAKYNALRIAYQDSSVHIIDALSPSYPLQYAEQLIDKNNINKAKVILQEALSKWNPKDRNYAFLAYTIARANALQGDLENQKLYLALSAASDVYCGVRENVALRELAMLLFADGDIDEAYIYIKIALGDALYSNARLRSFEILQVMPVIDAAYQDLKDKEKWTLMLFIFIALLLSSVLLASLLYSKQQKKKLQVANQQVKKANDALNVVNNQLELSNGAVSEVNVKLESLNSLQGEYISKYLKLCSSYIGRIDKYRLSMLKKAVSSNTSELLKMLKSKEVVDKELQAFYQDFDKAFLDLHPGFVAQFQTLLRDDEQILPKRGELLNTELRIFALVRLGITESSQIAEFLRYSNPTIYNYRTKVRNKANMDREAFDKAVQTL